MGRLLLFHEGQHKLNAGQFLGADMWKDEQSASRMQIKAGTELGLPKQDIDYLTKWSSDANKAGMQQHREHGILQGH